MTWYGKPFDPHRHRRAVSAADAFHAGRSPSGCTHEASRRSAARFCLNCACLRLWTVAGPTQIAVDRLAGAAVHERPAGVADAAVAAGVAVLTEAGNRLGGWQYRSSGVVRSNPRADCIRNGVRPCPCRCLPPRITGLIPTCAASAPNAAEDVQLIGLHGFMEISKRPLQFRAQFATRLDGTNPAVSGRMAVREPVTKPAATSPWSPCRDRVSSAMRAVGWPPEWAKRPVNQRLTFNDSVSSQVAPPVSPRAAAMSLFPAG